MNPIDQEYLETVPKNRMIGWFRLMVWCMPAFVIMAILIALGPVVYYLKIPESFFPFLLGGLSLSAVIALGYFVIPIVGFVAVFAVGM